ncbi:conserved Plasmodium protein, unknown function [Plasmodium sp. DRC-Itaito]|nr:conserved Plasmodium protein, unknown function [Plasmodium sp. DRC-Itaito]
MREINVNYRDEMKYEEKKKKIIKNNNNNNNDDDDDTIFQDTPIEEEEKFVIFLEKEKNQNIDDNNDDDKRTHYSSIDKSVHIINNSICNIKNNLKYIKTIININEATQSDYTLEDEDINSYKSSSDTSSFVKTYDNINEEEYTRKNSNENNFELLLNKVINSKKEEKQLDTLDIIDECISIGNLYNRKDKKDNQINEENKNNKIPENLIHNNNDKNNIIINQNMVSDDVLNISIEQKNKKNHDTPQINNINNDNNNNINSKQLENTSSNISSNISSNNKQKEKNKFSLFTKLNLIKNPNIQVDDTHMDEKYKDSRCGAIKTYSRLDIILYKLINLLPNEKRKKLDDYLRIFFKNKERLTILLREKKNLSNFMIYTFFFLSYIFFGFVIIFLKRIVYHIFYDQDL